jgi:hypothetical protein
MKTLEPNSFSCFKPRSRLDLLSFASLFMAAFWLVPALSREQGATAGYDFARKFAFD